MPESLDTTAAWSRLHPPARGRHRNDTHRNDAANHDQDISATDTAVRTMVITARENLQIANEARQLLT